MGELKKRLRRRFIFFMLALAFWLPALLIGFMETEAQQVLGTNVFVT